MQRRKPWSRQAEHLAKINVWQYLCKNKVLPDGSPGQAVTMSDFSDRKPHSMRINTEGRHLPYAPCIKPLSPVHCIDGSIHQAGEGAAWPFSYMAMETEGGWRTNLSHDPDLHSDRAAAWAFIEEHYTGRVARCLDSILLSDLLRQLGGELKGGDPAAAARLDRAADLAPETQLLAVRQLPMVGTRSGNMMSSGGWDFPWPFVSLLHQVKGGWMVNERLAPHAVSSYEDGLALVQELFEKRIGELVETRLAHEMKGDLRQAATVSAAVLSATINDILAALPQEASAPECLDPALL